MKTLNKNTAFQYLIISITAVLPFQESIGDYESTIAQWRNDSSAALSLTFDDNSWLRQTQAGILEEYGLRGTFHVITGQTTTSYQSMLQGLHTNGHEIGSHSITHDASVLGGDSLEDIRREIRDSKQFLEQLIGTPCVSYAYPYGYYTPEMQQIIAEYYLSARSTMEAPPVNYIPYNGTDGFDIYALAVNPWPRPVEAWSDEVVVDRYRQFAQDLVQAGGWGIEMFHGFADENSVMKITEAAFREHLSDLTDAGALPIWIAPQGTVAKYYLERQQSQICILDETEHSVMLDLRIDGDTDLLDIPLTLLTAIPDKWESQSIQIVHNGTSIPFQLCQKGDQTYVMYDVLPGLSAVTVSAPEPSTITTVLTVLPAVLWSGKRIKTRWSAKRRSAA